MSTKQYNDQYEGDKDNCAINHISASKVEIDVITEMFMRSGKKHHAKYTTCIGDGDSEAHKNINPYEDIIV